MLKTEGKKYKREKRKRKGGIIVASFVFTADVNVSEEYLLDLEEQLLSELGDRGLDRETATYWYEVLVHVTASPIKEKE